uniref:Uncharacterized protein n=1 Tax=Trypanosoma vivax (strain Y486) TaxID=1055687 RepID=G0U4X2_TRYVY|nr:hypothetical protein TVY486_1015290 [Trypanosoma vivax Y486]
MCTFNILKVIISASIMFLLIYVSFRGNVRTILNLCALLSSRWSVLFICIFPFCFFDYWLLILMLLSDFIYIFFFHNNNGRIISLLICHLMRPTLTHTVCQCVRVVALGFVTISVCSHCLCSIMNSFLALVRCS